MNIPYQIRKERVLNRDNITEESFVLRESSSIEYEEYDFDIILNKKITGISPTQTSIINTCIRILRKL